MDETHSPQILDELDAVQNYGIASIPVEQWSMGDADCLSTEEQEYYDMLDEFYAEVEDTQRSLQFPH